MHLSTNGVKRSGMPGVALGAAMIALSVLMVAGAQPAGEGVPSAAPRVQAAQTAPATQSPEEVLWQRIFDLRQLPSAPPGATQPLENPEFVRSLSQQLEKSLQATGEYLEKYPKGEHAEEVEIQRLDTIRLLAVANKQPLDEFQAEAQKVLKSGVSTNVKAAAEYMLMGIQMDAYARELSNSDLSPEQREQAWRQAVIQRANEFIGKYPTTAFAERFYVLLIDGALQQGNVEQARSVFEQMRKSHPQSQFLAEIGSAIQEVAAATQSAATRPGAATRAGATQPGEASEDADAVPDIAIQRRGPASQP